MTPEQVQSELEEAGKTLFLMRLPANGIPAGYRGYWPDIVRNGAEMFGAQVSMTEGQRKDFATDRNRTRISPSARQISHWEKTWQWLFLIENTTVRQITAARSLKYPASDRHVASLRKLAGMLRCNHEHIRRLHYKGLCEISRKLEYLDVGDSLGDITARFG